MHVIYLDPECHLADQVLSCACRIMHLTRYWYTLCNPWELFCTSNIALNS